MSFTVASRRDIYTESLERLPIPATVHEAGPEARQRFIEFFTATIRNPNTRRAYAIAARDFFSWIERRGIGLKQIDPVVVAAYIELHPGSPATVKQHLASLRRLFDWLVLGHIMQSNPAHSVRGPRYSVRRGKTPVLSPEDTRKLIQSIDIGTVTGLRDRAIIGIMVYSFARIGAVVKMQVEDYYPQGKRWWLRLHEKRGKVHEVPAHHRVEAYLDEYIAAAGIEADRKGPLFRVVDRHGRPTDRRLEYIYAYHMVKRRARRAGLDPEQVTCHTFRATGITTYLSNGGTLENAQRIAAHESPRTTMLYDRRSDEIDLVEIERIAI